MSPWKVILATMVIFGSGVVTGSLLFKMELPAGGGSSEPTHISDTATNQTPPWAAQVQRQEFLRRMQKQLNLTPEQHDQILKIMKESQERSRPLWNQIAPQMREETKRVREQIRETLTPEQQVKFDELLKGRPRKQPNARPLPGSPSNAP